MCSRALLMTLASMGAFVLGLSSCSKKEKATERGAEERTSVARDQRAAMEATSEMQPEAMQPEAMQPEAMQPEAMQPEAKSREESIQGEWVLDVAGTIAGEMKWSTLKPKDKKELAEELKPVAIQITKGKVTGTGRGGAPINLTYTIKDDDRMNRYITLEEKGTADGMEVARASSYSMRDAHTLIMVTNEEVFLLKRKP